MIDFFSTGRRQEKTTSHYLALPLIVLMMVPLVMMESGQVLSHVQFHIIITVHWVYYWGIIQENSDGKSVS